MKKRCFKLSLIVAALFVGAFFMSACNGQNSKVVFNESSFVMGTNQEQSLESFVSLENINISSVKFVSSNPNIVAVSPRQTLISGELEGSAIISANGFEGFIEITVSGSSLSFSSPTNLHFNQDTGCLEWDNVYVGKFVANQYKLLITQNENAPEQKIVNTNSFKLEGYGSFKVTVSCMERIGIKESEPCNEYSFSKLEAPNNLKYNSSTNTLSWSRNGNSYFVVKKDGVVSNLISENFVKLDLLEEKTHTISVTSASQQENVFGSQSETLTLTRLNTPKISVENASVKWEDLQTGVNFYVLNLYKISNSLETLIKSEKIPYNGFSYSYNLDKIETGAYNVKIYANGEEVTEFTQNNHFLNSAVSSTGEITKLKNQTIVFDKNLKQISVEEFSDDNKLSLIVEHNNETEEIDISQNGKLVYDFTEEGMYSFTVINKSKNNTEIDSDSSNTIVVNQLPTLNNLVQSITNDNYKLTGIELLNGATSYKVEKVFNENTQELTQGDNSSYGSVNTLFNQAGDYKIVITLSGTDSNNSYVLNSKTTLNVKKLSNVTLTNDETSQQITWQTDEDSNNLKFLCTVSDGTITTTQNTNFDYSNLAAGQYTFQVVTMKDSSKDVLYVDSNNSNVVQFKIEKQINTPEINLTKENNNHYLVITPQQNANLYTISINSVQLEPKNHDSSENIKICVDKYLANAGTGENNLTYNFEVYAENAKNTFNTKSKTATLTAQKIAAPTSFSVSETEQISTTIPENFILSYSVLIDENETANLSEVENKTEYQVKIKYISDMQNYNGIVYIDSDYSMFKLTRMPIQIKQEGLVLTSEALKTTQSFTKTALITQNNNSYHNITINNCGEFNLDVEYHQLIKDGLCDYQNGVNLCFKYNFKIDNAEIVGSYNNGVFESVNQSFYISGTSNFVSIKLADKTLNTQVKENNSSLQISWNKKENAKYTFDCLFVTTDTKSNKMHEENKNSITVDITDVDLLKGSLVMAITETILDETTIYLAYSKRVASAEINVGIDESITSITTPENVQKVLFTQSGKEITSLSNIGQEETEIDVQTIANTNDSFFFYLNGLKKSYTFKRLEKVDGIKIENSTLIWNSSSEETNFVYLLEFSDSDNNTKFIELDKKVTSVDLTNSTYQQILKSLTGNKKYVAIKKVINGNFTAETNKTNIISSGYSNKTELIQIATPTNLQVIVDQNNLKQNKLTISWTISNFNDVSIKEYIVEISHGGKTENVTSIGAFTIDENSNYFKESGEWSVRVIAIGNEASISSNFSEKLTVTRLKTTTISVDKNGTISWTEINNSNGYKVECSYNSQSGETIRLNEDVDANNTSLALLKNIMNEIFDGNVSINVYAKGDGTNTLSSFAETTVERLQAPEISIINSNVVVSNFNAYPQNTKFFATCKIDEHIVINQQIQIEKNTNEQFAWALPTEFSYLDEYGTIQIIDLSTQKELNISVYASNDNYLNSNSTTKSTTILSPLTNLRFVRENSVVKFKATNNNNYSNFKITIGTYSEFLSGDANGNVNFDITDEILKKFNSSWTIQIQAIGNSSGEYINSKIETISGTKLSKVTSFKTNEWNVEWGQILKASSYSIKINSNAWETCATNSKSFKTDNSQTYSIQARAVGNVNGQEEISIDVVLDGDISEIYTFTKLAEVTDFSVVKGYFTFTEIENVSEYVVEAYSNEECTNLVVTYCLEEQDLKNILINNTNKYYSCPDLNNKLEDCKTLYIKSYAKTEQSNYVYSNYAKNEGLTCIIKVENLNNASAIELSHPENERTKTIDYLTTTASWDANTNSSNGFVLNIDNNLQYITETSYCLDKNKDWNSGNHSISYMQLGSELNKSGTTYLTYKFTEQTILTKLESVNVYVNVEKNGDLSEPYITFDAVSGANLYYSYLSDEFYASHNNSSTKLSMESLNSNITYQSFGMIAVNTSNVNILASTINYITKTNSKNEVVNVKLEKDKTPIIPTFKNGAFYWGIDTSEWKEIIVSEEKLTNLFTKQIKLTFTSKNFPSIKYQYVDNVSNYILLSDSQKQTLINYYSSISGVIGLSKQEIETTIDLLQFNLPGGFASVNYGFNKFASDLPVGEYTISISLVGSGIVEVNDSYTAKFSSDYVELPQTIYVAPATEITAVASEGNYSINFNNINVNTEYITSAPTYILVGRKLNKTYDTMEDVRLAEVIATGLNNSEKLSFNLTKLIEDKELTSDYTELYVIVKGNNSTLNGKTSNIINIKILDTIVAYAEHGEITWKKVENATQYAITYKLSEGQPSTEIIANSDSDYYKWDGDTLTTDTEYTVSVQAQGYINKKVKNSETFIMSGILLNIGKVYKLTKIASVSIKNGVFEWSKIDNATAYEIYADKALLEEITTLQFETTVSDTSHHSYTFKAIGTESVALNETTTMYLNSQLSDEKYAQRVEQIDSISFKDGLIEFTPLQTTGYYKLTFYNLTNGTGKREDSNPVVVYLENTTKYDTNTNPELLSAGNYDLDIQACYKDERIVKGKENTNTFYVISKANSATYYKFEQVTNINVNKGKITWDFENSDNKPDADFEFKLMFKSYSTKTTEKIVSSSQKDENGKYYYENVVFDDIKTTDEISLTIHVVPTSNAGNYVKSVASEEKSGIHQYAKIDSTKITMKIENGKLVIDWANGVDKTITNEGSLVTDENQSFRYELKIKIENQEKIVSNLTNSNYTFTDEDLISKDGEGNIVDVQKVALQIRVIPEQENYISSVWSGIKEISKPKQVSGLEYDQTKQIFTWDKYETSQESSYQYKIVDVVTTTEKTTETYIIFAEIGDEMFTPFILGNHNVSVYIMVTNSNTDAFISSPSFISGGFNLFASGKGTKDDPYLIADANQFKNMTYRANIDTKIKSVLKEEHEEQTITYTTIDWYKDGYFFKQNDDLGIDNDNIVTDEFNGVFDGNYKTLTLNYTQPEKTESVSLFKTIGENGKLENIKLMLSLNILDTNKIELYVLSGTNNGKINNVLIGDNSTTITIKKNNDKIISFITCQNNGTISNIVNYYNINLTEETENGKTTTFAPIANENNGTISQVKNNGTISITGTNIYVGGIVAQNLEGGKITQAGNSGNMNINYKNNPTTESSLIGGIVANNTSSIRYCYCDCNISIVGSVDKKVYVGGLFGQSSSLDIGYSYVKVSFNKSDSNADYTKYNVYYIGCFTTTSTQTFDTVYYYVKHDNVNSANTGTFTIASNNLTATNLSNGKEYDFNDDLTLKFESSFKKEWQDKTKEINQ